VSERSFMLAAAEAAVVIYHMEQNSN